MFPQNAGQAPYSFRVPRPRHVAIIMDGNGRWAKNNCKMRVCGHKAGVKSVRRAVSFAVQNSLDALTLYAFSSENWRRPVTEVTSLLNLFVCALRHEVKNLHKNNICLNIIGDTSQFSTSLQDHIARAESLTEKNDGLKLNIAANYGGRWDITQSVRKLARKVQEGLLQPEQLNEELINSCICLNTQSPIDLVIRTGGNHRISNFLLWQTAYAELYFTDILWPDFDEPAFETALEEFSRRERRFGGLVTPPVDINEQYLKELI